MTSSTESTETYTVTADDLLDIYRAVGSICDNHGVWLDESDEVLIGDTVWCHFITSLDGLHLNANAGEYVRIPSYRRDLDLWESADYGAEYCTAEAVSAETRAEAIAVVASELAASICAHWDERAAAALNCAEDYEDWTEFDFDDNPVIASIWRRAGREDELTAAAPALWSDAKKLAAELAGKLLYIVWGDESPEMIADIKRQAYDAGYGAVDVVGPANLSQARTLDGRWDDEVDLHDDGLHGISWKWELYPDEGA